MRYPHNIDSCEFGDLCAFAHSEDELSIDMLHKMDRDADFYMFHFKTVWCPFNDKNRGHQRDECEYAHNWQDFRRKPHLYEYRGREQCKFWDTKEETKTYSDGCELEYRCKNCHGWKEKEYHPDNYKTQECELKSECRKRHCPYYHNEAEKRTPKPGFRLFPRNRGTTVGQAQVYQDLYLQVMFRQTHRINQVKPFRKANQIQYASQSIYGCGPQSTPVVNPQLVLQF